MASQAFPHLKQGLRESQAMALSMLASEAFPKFVQSKACLPLVERLVSIGDVASAEELLWSGYTVPPDVAGWIRAFASIAETFPASIVLSDMSMSGNPMFFVNREFCRTTGYSKEEVHGRNCRFLQGPRTEPESVAVIQDALRRGVDCFVKITNYRKSGEMFTNLLTMRPVHDTNGVYRFCIGLQFEVGDEGEHELVRGAREAQLERLCQIVKQLPSTIEVSGPPVGPVHQIVEDEEARSTELSVRFENALAGPHPQTEATVAITPMAEEYGRNHAIEITRLGIRADHCEHVDALARAFGVAPPYAGPWLQMLCDVLEHVPVAMTVVNMQEPGCLMSYVNPAMVALTGYSRRELEGRNCRVLQGPKTEPEAVAKMVDAIRKAAPLTLELTNYKRDGTEFLNVLTLKPVRDSTGVYRYCIGVIWSEAHADELASAQGESRSFQRKALDKLFRALPEQFDATLPDSSGSIKSTEARTPHNTQSKSQRRRWVRSLMPLVKVQWQADYANDWRGSLEALLRSRGDVPLFRRWLHQCGERGHVKIVDNLVAIYDAVFDSKELSSSDAMIDLCRELIGSLVVSSAVAKERLVQYATSEARLKELSSSYEAFIQSFSLGSVVERRLDAIDDGGSCHALLWNDYTLSPDVSGWLLLFTSVAEQLPVSICLSDMTLPQGPMVYTNQAFSAITGFSKEEAQGRNCRFLQGPRTEPESVATILDALRRGVPCCVKITNYRKSGEMFTNLLTMRPVHDTNGVYRFCIGVQHQVSAASPPSKQLELLEQILPLLPSKVDVTGRPIGPVHQRSPAEDEANAHAWVAVCMSRALGDERGASGEDAILTGTVTPLVQSFASNHADILLELCGTPTRRIPRADEDEDAFAEPRTIESSSAADALGVQATGSDLTPARTPITVRELREMLVTQAADPQLQAMASLLSLRPPPPGAWLEQLGFLAAQLPHALLVVDMTDGVTIDYVNHAFEQLTGYSIEESRGRNCKFLQGSRTEAVAVRRISQVIQGEKHETLRITNYRKDGSIFKNNLTVHPVHDCAGVYRYSIGILSDAADEQREGPALAKLRRALPTMIDHLQQQLSDDKVMNSDLALQFARTPRARSVRALQRRGSTADGISSGLRSAMRVGGSGSNTPRTTGSGGAAGSGGTMPKSGHVTPPASRSMRGGTATPGRTPCRSPASSRPSSAAERRRLGISVDTASRLSPNRLPAGTRGLGREQDEAASSDDSRCSSGSKGTNTTSPGAVTPPATPRICDGDGTPRYYSPPQHGEWPEQWWHMSAQEDRWRNVRRAVRRHSREASLRETQAQEPWQEASTRPLSQFDASQLDELPFVQPTPPWDDVKAER